MSASKTLAWILGTGTSAGKDPTHLRALPEYRKASEIMCLAALAIEDALAGSETLPKATLASVLGTCYGELETTKDFLAAWARSRLARPILFQTSLHNATLGFLALKRGLTGPSFTVSDACFPGERALETALSLLDAGIATHCLVIAVDGWVQELAPALKRRYPETLELVPSASAILLARDRGEHRPLAALTSLEISMASAPEPMQGNYSDSDGLARFALAIHTRASGEIHLPKPNGGHALIRWTSP